MASGGVWGGNNTNKAANYRLIPIYAVRKAVSIMAAPLTDLQKKKIVADYARLGNYSAVARENGVADETARRVCNSCGDMSRLVEQKNEQNTQDIIAYMESQRSKVCDIIGKGLDVLLTTDKLEGATPSQITTMIGTLIDKWAAINGTDSAQLTKAREILEGVDSAID